MIKYFTIITSTKDPASNTMINYLLDNEEFEITNKGTIGNQNNHNNANTDFKVLGSLKHLNTALVITNQDLIDINNLDGIIPKENMVIFLSKHASKSKTPTLTSHSTGNFSDIVLLGGKPKEIGNTFPSFQKVYMKKIYEKRQGLFGYDLTIEATHHGPTSLANPTLFIEIGSSEIQWVNKTTASIVCKSVLESIKDIEKYIENNNTTIGIGIGGNHYPQKYNELILFSNVAFGPIISKYNLAFINEQIMKQVKGKSIEKINHIYVDDKGLGKDKEKVLNILDSQDLEIIFI
ncbi:MAG: D-aminoacyl-tRNA deacylase [Candidatus Nitrosocosmicus sp.]